MVGIIDIGLDLDKVLYHIENGNIARSWHPSGELQILNYTPRCVYNHLWDKETLTCRGLIVDKNWNVVSRSFSRFFNLEEHSRSDIVFSKPFRIYDKYDGSCGILYFGPDGFAIATRGSFASDQAIWATECLHRKYSDFVLACETSAHISGGVFPETWIFEIIYNTNRIVVNYDFEDLVLLAVLDTETGRDLCEPENSGWHGRIAKSYDINCNPADVVKALNPQNDGSAEGFVLRFDYPETGPQTRIKIKLDEYVRLHRILTNITTKSVWEYLSRGESFDELLDRTPDEFHGWLKGTIRDLKAKYKAIYDAAWAEFLDIMRKICGDSIFDFDINGNCIKVRETKRKEFAELAKNSKYPSLLFCMLDANYEKTEMTIWKLVKPLWAKPFHQDIDN